MALTIDELNIQIVAETTSATQALDILISKLKTVQSRLNGLGTAGKNAGKGMQDTAKGATKVNDAVDKQSKNYDKASKSTKSFTDRLAQQISKYRTLIGAFKSAANMMGSWFQESNDYIETVNLFNVTMGDAAPAAREYAKAVEEAMGIDSKDFMQYQGVFKNLTAGFGVAEEDANKMSQNLTQLSYDMMSFFNATNVEESFDKLSSAMSGQVKGLREYGIDTTVATLQEYALSKGIQTKVRNMTQAEKSMLRYNYIMEKSTHIQGDMARTLITPANAMRILSSQITRLKRALGNIVSVIVTKFIPYVQAMVEMLTEAASAIAKWAGFNEKDFEADTSGIKSSWGAAEEGVDDYSDSLKEAKKQMMGFDELNIISNPNSDSGASDIGGVGGALNGMELAEYDFLAGLKDNNLDDIKEKLKDILKWAGLIGGAIAAWKFTTNFATGMNAITSLFGKGSKGGKAKGSKFQMPNAKTVLKGLANLAIIIGGVIAIAGVMGLLSKIPGFQETVSTGMKTLGIVFKGLGEIAIPLALATVGVYLLSKIKVGDFAKGFANFSIILGGTATLITAIGALLSIPYFGGFLSTGIESLKATFNGLYDIAVPIGLLSALMIGLGCFTTSTIALGLAGFAIIVAGTAVLITAIGALMAIPHFKGFLSGGIESIKSMFEGLWDVAIPIGALSVLIVGLGFATPAVVASGLAGFAIIIGGFAAVLLALGALKQIPGFDWLVGEGGELLAKLGNILGKFAGSIVGGLAEGISASLPQIGKDLSAFMDEAKGFFDGLKGIDESSSKAVGYIADAVLTLTKTNILKGLTSWMTGENSLVEFGKELKEFAPYFTSYYKEIKSVDAGVITATANAAKALVEMADNVPNSGGVASWFAGENNIDTFGKKLPSFGKNFKEYYNNIKGIDGSVVEASSTAAKSIVEIAKNIPNEGGVAAWFAGDNGIDKFGAKLPKFGKDFKAYYDSVKGIATSTLNNITTGLNNLVNFAKKVKTDVDNNAIEKFAKALKSLADNMAKLPTQKNIGLTVEYSTWVSNEKKKVYEALGLAGWPTMRWYAYAQGGFPDVGEMFIAREAGPELVGSIGRKTAVANNDQIVSGIESGVYRAMVAANSTNKGGTQTIRIVNEIDGDIVGEKVIQYHNGKVIQTGVSPLLV